MLGRLADTGNTMIMIEHNLEVIKTADYIIDLGPEGGDRGGRSRWPRAHPRKSPRPPNSYTGQFLRQVLAQRAAA